MKSLGKRLFEQKMLVKISWVLDKLQNIFCVHSVALDLLVDPELSGKLLKLLQRQLLYSHN